MKAAKTTVTKLGIKRIPWLELRSQNREKGKNRKRTRCEPQGETSGEAVGSTRKRHKVGKQKSFDPLLSSTLTTLFELRVQYAEYF